MTDYATEQEAFWAGEFGNAYIDRNQGEQIFAGNLALFSQVLGRTHAVGSVLELGANIGVNLQAIHALLPNARLEAVEINAKAVKRLRETPFVSGVYQQSILDYPFEERTYDLVFTKGVLIHLDPSVLPQVYDRMLASSVRYVMVAEYYNPSPMGIGYRGHSNKLFKRDFAGEMLERFPNLRLVDYGFRYRRDSNWPQDDITWFLMEKT